MNLRTALSFCSNEHQDDWVEIPGQRPATTMLGGMFDPGTDTPQLRPLVGGSVAVYEPDARLSLVWQVPEDDRYLEVEDRPLPEWAETDPSEWKSARSGWAVVLLGGAPIWQSMIWYLNWGAGIGGYVPNFRPVFGRDNVGDAPLKGWETSAWEVGLARLIESFDGTGGLGSHDPTLRVCPRPTSVHPIDKARGHA